MSEAAPQSRVRRQRVDAAIFSAFPEYVRVVLVATGLDNQSGGHSSEEMLAEAAAAARERFVGDDVAHHPRLASWREAFARLGMETEAGDSSFASLVRRAAQGGDITSTNSLVDLLNAFSLRHLVPWVGDDAGRVSGDLWLRLARGREFFTPIGGGKPVSPALGEVIYVDSAETALCRYWNGRPADAARITPGTRDAVVNLDCLPPVTQAEALELGHELAALIERHCGGKVETRLITIDRPAVELSRLDADRPPMRGQRIGG